MIILQIILLLILGFILLILFAPFSYSALVQIEEKINVNVFLHWIIVKLEFSINENKPLVKFSILGKQMRFSSFSNKKAKHNKKEEKKKSGIPSKEFILQMISLIKEVFKVIKPKEFIAKGTYSFEDPSMTGILNMILIFINEVMPWAKIDLYPEYEAVGMSMEIEIYGSVRPIVLIFIALKYLLNKEVRKVIFHKYKKIETFNNA